MLVMPVDGPPISDALDVVGDAFGQETDLVVIPVERLAPEFFDLRTGIAGEMLQKFANYRLRLAVVGDISAFVASSNALRDLVRESNRGGQAWFVPDMAALKDRLAWPGSARVTRMVLR